jgi:hypothetical protein
MNLAMAASWLQSRWCLYTCWILQFPAFASLAVILVLASDSKSGPPGIIEYVYHLSLCLLHRPNTNTSLPHSRGIGLTLLGLMIFLYICQPILYFMNRLTPTHMLWMQVFESAFIIFIGSPIIPGKNFWRISDFTAWTVVYTC